MEHNSCCATYLLETLGWEMSYHVALIWDPRYLRLHADAPLLETTSMKCRCYWTLKTWPDDDESCLL